MSHDGEHKDGAAPIALTTDQTASEECITMFSGGHHRRSPSTETIATATSEDTVSPPPVPVNSPESSVLGEQINIDLVTDIDTIEVADRLASQHITSSNKKNVHSKLELSQIAEEMSATDDTFEHTTWVDLAEEDVSRALTRLAMAAKDINIKSAGQKNVQEVYSTRLAKLIKQADITFDARHLE